MRGCRISSPSGVVRLSGPSIPLVRKWKGKQASSSVVRVLHRRTACSVLFGLAPTVTLLFFCQGGAIIFIDELDAIGTKRFGGEQSGDREVQRTMLELLNQLDGFSSNDKIKVQSTLFWHSFTRPRVRYRSIRITAFSFPRGGFLLHQACACFRRYSLIPSE